jgi:hypothetical protein
MTAVLIWRLKDTRRITKEKGENIPRHIAFAMLMLRRAMQLPYT